MTSLTKVAIATRKGIRYFFYLVILGIFLKISIDIGSSIYKRIFPAPPPAPTVAFGKIPPISFPENKGLPQFNYTVETTEGSFPSLSQQTKVYYMPKLSSNLLALELARQKALGLGFVSEGEKVSETVYKFTNPRNASKMEINIVTGSFSISYDLASDTTPLSKRPPIAQTAESLVRTFLANGGTLPDDLTGKAKYQFLKTEVQQLVPALSLSEANLIRISLFRKSLDDLPSMPADPIKGNVWFIVSGDTSRDKQIIAGEYRYFPLDETQASTYPLKTAGQAFEDLKAAKGYVASLGNNSDGNVVIRRIYLAYYDPNLPDNFYQPIIVFEGDRNFVAYVPAVTDAFINLSK
ncbi:MAG: hypothetical protein AAB546_01445 [Patescibacteria group bacterium]